MTTKELRRKSGMTQKQFAEYFGIPLRTIENWDAGVRNAAPYIIDLMLYKLRHEGKVENCQNVMIDK